MAILTFIRNRIRVPPRRHGPDARIEFLRAEEQVPGRLGTECHLVIRPASAQVTLLCKTICLTMADMVGTITIRTDEETEHALDVLTHDGSSRSAAIRQAVLDAARRRERAAEMRRAVLRMDLGQPDGVNVAEELARDRASER